MFSFIAGIGSWLFGKVAGTALDRVLNIIDKTVPDEIEREKLRTEVITKSIQAEIEHASIRKDAFGKWSALMAFLFLPGPAIWWTMVFIDSSFPSLFPGYAVQALPSNFYPWIATIIGAIFFAPVVNRFGKK
jgi:hypothetical protein